MLMDLTCRITGCLMKMLAMTVHLREDWEYSITCKQLIFNSSCEFNSLISYKNFAEEINDDMDWASTINHGSTNYNMLTNYL